MQKDFAQCILFWGEDTRQVEETDLIYSKLTLLYNSALSRTYTFPGGRKRENGLKDNCVYFLKFYL